MCRVDTLDRERAIFPSRVGRAKAVFVGSLIHAVATVVVASTTNLFALLFGRFVVGVTNLMILIPIVTLGRFQFIPSMYF